MKRRTFLQSIIGGVTALFMLKAKAKPLTSDIYSPNNPNSKVKWRKWAKLDKCPEAYTREDIEAASGINEVMLGEPLARLDCGEAECIHYRWLGCHGCDDPANQSACALRLEKGYECLMSEDHIWFESYKDVKPLQLDLGKRALDMCDCRDYLYVLLEGGELWRAYKGGEYFGKPFFTWQMVHQYPWMVEHLEVQTPSWIVGVGKIDGEKVNFGGYLIGA